MKKEVILVPKDKCPMDVLAEMGERTKNSWIFLHEDAVKQLKKTADHIEEVEFEQFEELVWHATEKYPETILGIDEYGIWHRVYRIVAEDIAFEHEVEDPEDIYFLKMAE